MDDHKYHDPNRRSVSGHLSAIVDDAINLVRGEVALARAEANEKVGQLGAALVMAVLGTALIMAALVILLQAIVLALVEMGIHSGWSALIVGGGTVIVGIILLMSAKSKFSAENLAPSKTMEQMRRDREAIKETRL
ncbi:phage holin family protein [Paracoccus sediminicola]|uniref:phage holin family protein n=1 Tax=Paracoccus sediminicola TaxID=3017783 RepID=UPI0022F04012|nr:phage holin family protein [Paracoccus sediminicola]WBU55701.1 phage holin family protein [Paracoccus sediminicola]